MTLPPNVVESRQLDHTDGWAIPSCYLVYSLLKVRNESYVTSIHAPHTGSDLGLGPLALLVLISIHAPHTGSDRYKL